MSKQVAEDSTWCLSGDGLAYLSLPMAVWSIVSPVLVAANPLTRAMILPRFLLSLILSVGLLPAADLTVNNNPGAVADFSSLSAALAAASPGDRLLISGSATTYGNVTVATSGLTLVGVGYLRSENGLPPDATGSNQSAKFSLTVGGSANPINGLTVIGCELGFLGLTGNHSNLLFDRCQIGGFPTVENESQTRFTRCYFVGGLNILSSTDCSVLGSILGSLVLRNSAVASHCVIRATSSTTFPGQGSTILGIDATSAASNLIIDMNGSASGQSPVYQGSITHSIGLGNAGLPAGGGNQDNLQRADVVLATGSPDGFWRLTTTSPALLAASDGTDVGAFGGPSPYVLSGVPGAPRITRMLVPALASPTTGISIQVEIDQDTP